MSTEKELKEIVKDRYAKIALQDKDVNASSCCGATTPTNKVYNIMMEDYSEMGGYNEDADLGLGCGLPTQFAKISKGDTVIDLGSGAGNDCFVARHEAGETGKVIGVDFTPIMIKKARENSEKLGYNNVEFREGDIDDMPISDDVADVIVSNCVLNLVPNKEKVGIVTKDQVRQIAEQKMVDLNASSVETAMLMIEGTARSMGIEVN